MRYGSSHRERVTSAVWSFLHRDDFYAAATSIRRREKKLTVRPKEGCHRGGQRGKASLMGNPTEDGVIMGNGSGCYGIIQHTYIAFLQLLKICAVKEPSNLLTDKKKQQNPGFPFFKKKSIVRAVSWLRALEKKNGLFSPQTDLFSYYMRDASYCR